jgi:hypothetical protein
LRRVVIPSVLPDMVSSFLSRSSMDGRSGARSKSGSWEHLAALGRKGCPTSEDVQWMKDIRTGVSLQS